MDAVSVTAAVQAVGLLCATLLGLAGVARLAVGWLDRRLDLRDEKQERRWEHALDARLEPITRELRPNGGTSLRDRVDATAGKVDALATREAAEHDAIDRRHRRNVADLARLRREVMLHVRVGHPAPGSQPAPVDDALIEALDVDDLHDP